MRLRIPTNRALNSDDEALNVGVDYIDVEIRIDPNYPLRGEHIPAYGGDIIFLRESNEQVLLHEILHVALRNVPEIRTEKDPHGHNIISRIEVALWETGWRRIDGETL